MRPHNLNPTRETAHLVLAYKNFAAVRGQSHIGLGVSAMNVQKVLRAQGLWVDVWPVSDAAQLEERLQADHSAVPVSHVIIAAPWIPTEVLGQLCQDHPNVNFAVLCHSNVGFLQADPGAVRLVREELELQRSTHNFRVAGNTTRFTDWLERAEEAECLTLPNLYDVADAEQRQPRPPWAGTLLRVGCFGASRVLKNVLTAAAAALEMATLLRTDLEFCVSGGRPEGGGVMMTAVKELLAGRPRARLVEVPWSVWAGFRRQVRAMDVLLHPSYTESFMMVVADGIAEGVPSVVGPAVDWVPSEWVAEVDDAGHLARVGTMLLHDPYAPRAGLKALQDHVAAGVRAWTGYLLGQQ